MRPDFDFLRRLGSLIQQLGGGAWDGDAAYVSVVDDRSYNSSRERAPYAYDWFTIGAAGAGQHNAIIIDGLDGPTGSTKPLSCMLHHLFLNSPGVTSGFSIGIVPLSALTLSAGPTARTPLCVDVDPEVAPRIRTATMATANLPAVAAAGMMILQSFPTEPFFEGAQTARWLPLIQWDAPDRVLFAVQRDANAVLTWRAGWQAVRK